MHIWWSDENQNDPDKKMEKSTITTIMDRTREYYRKMSFDSIDLTYQGLDQTKFAISSVHPGFYDTEDAARAYLKGKGYSFDGIILNYHLAQAGPFDGHGGWGDVNSKLKRIRLLMLQVYCCLSHFGTI